MICSTCKTELVPVLYYDDKETGWVCQCIVVIQVSIIGRQYGSQTYMAADYKQGAVRSSKCPNQPK